MKISLSTDAITTVKADLLAIGVGPGDLGKRKDLKTLDSATGDALSKAAKDEGFKGERGETLKLPVSGIGASWVVLIGLGSDAKAAHAAQLLGARAAQEARQQKSLALALHDASADSVRAAADGILRGAYRYDRYLTGDRKPKGGLKSAAIVVDKKDKSHAAALREGEVIGEATNLARDLVNAPPNDLTATALANEAKKAATAAGAQCKILNKKQIEQAGMWLLLAVNRGSKEEPRFIHISYKPKGAKKRVVFVGKGLTFDSGGLCIKPPKGMADMKCDMAGAATTIGVVTAAARLKLPVEVHGVIASTDNMSGGDAYRPGDVFPSLDGKTVEIINTDAEGRLILADALAYTRKLSPDFVIDHATLTGACMVALGKWTAGLFANDDDLGRRYREAAEQSGESFWHMPLTEDLRETLKSDIADIKHTGDTWGGAITAALFLSEFVGKNKWVHCDIAGPAFLDAPHGLHPKGGTGFGVATGVAFLRALAGR